ncbi:MAG: dockerin type I repeat-containing protein [Pirellulales bacterium]
MHHGVVATFLLLLFALTTSRTAVAGDLNTVPLFNGERNDSLNLWGGPFGVSSGATFTKQSSVVNSGTGAYQFNLGSVAGGDFRFFQAFSGAVNYTQDPPNSGNFIYRQDRDLTRYSSLQTAVRNTTGVPLTLTIELKDYRDLGSQLAERSFSIPAGPNWSTINAPLDLSSGWNVVGSPDLTRTFAVTYKVKASSGPLSGAVYFDDANLIEKGPTVNVQTAPVHDIVEQLAKRQFLGLWESRNKTTGIIPNTSDNVTTGALNTTTGVVWNLPSAVRHGWVTQAAADAYMGQLVTSLNANRNQTTYLPSRFLDLATAAPGSEESTIDASFLALALHNYKSQPTTPAQLRSDIHALENRFNFAAFVSPSGFRMAYSGGNISTAAYNGYTNENKVVAMAAAVSTDHNVALVNMWNKDTDRTLDSLVTPQKYLVMPSTEWRSAYVQALFDLFVDTSSRGADNYPDRALARNPWANFLRYETDAAAKLAQLGRSNLMQPDAGAGAGTYHTWNLYNNFGQPNLFQPWSVAEMVLAGAPGAEDSLRFLLDNGLVNGLDGVLGLADSAQWATAAANPTSVPSFADNWNITLSTMALMAYLDGPDRTNLFFANLPEVKAALDSVFKAGDYNGNGVVDIADYNYWRSTLGSINSLAADGNNNGVVDAADYVIWRDRFNAAGVGAGVAVPEPAVLGLLLAMGAPTVSRRRARHPETSKFARRDGRKIACLAATEFK